MPYRIGAGAITPALSLEGMVGIWVIERPNVEINRPATAARSAAVAGPC
jgi:hypothetical protein